MARLIRARRSVPFAVRILIGVALGIAAGALAGTGAAPLEQLGLLVIRMLKTLATPLIVFAVLDAFLRTRIPARKGALLVGLSLLNAVVAVGIGLGVSRLLATGHAWEGRIEEIRGRIAPAASAAAAAAPDATLSPLAAVSRLVPANLVDPFRENSILAVIVLAVLAGAALRALKDRDEPGTRDGLRALEGGVRTAFAALAQIMRWIVGLLPFAVFGVVAGVVGRTGPGIFVILGIFLATMALGLLLHGLGWYSVLLAALGRVSPVWFFRRAADSILTALSSSSSLATLPVTLRCLEDGMRVSPSSARLAACVGTNLNHDGIILYEASAAIFMLQAFGHPVTAAGVVAISLAAVMAGIGIAGVPEAGLITLPLVLGAAGLPDAVALAVIPLILPVDWILGRLRAAVNVTSDMTVAVLLDRLA